MMTFIFKAVLLLKVLKMSSVVVMRYLHINLSFFKIYSKICLFFLRSIWASLLFVFVNSFLLYFIFCMFWCLFLYFQTSTLISTLGYLLNCFLSFFILSYRCQSDFGSFLSFCLLGMFISIFDTNFEVICFFLVYAFPFMDNKFMTIYFWFIETILVWRLS